MPTAYTAKVADGKVADLAEFLRPMARAFGFMIEMRDEPFNAPWPEEFKPTAYHAECLAKAQDTLAELKRMLPDEIEEAAEQKYQSDRAEWQKQIAEAAATRARYETMLKKVVAWKPDSDPEGAMTGIRKFAIEQIETSIQHDCDWAWSKEPVRQSADEWLRAAIENAQWNVGYHTEHHTKELERVAARNACLKAFREELAKLEASALSKSAQSQTEDAGE